MNGTKKLGDRLHLELDHVLAWLVAGYQDWRANGLGDPEQVIKATEAYKAESDALGRFLDQRCMVGHGTVSSKELFAAWSKWCTDEGEEPTTQTAFAAALQNKGLDNYTLSGRRRWRGISLAADEGEGW